MYVLIHLVLIYTPEYTYTRYKLKNKQTPVVPPTSTWNTSAVEVYLSGTRVILLYIYRIRVVLVHKVPPSCRGVRVRSSCDCRWPKW